MGKNEKQIIKLDRFTNKQLNKWVLEKLENEPFLYGGDIGNPAIMKAYLEEAHSIILPLEALSACASVSRRKNSTLKIRVDLDKRVKNAIKREKTKLITLPFPELLEDDK